MTEITEWLWLLSWVGAVLTIPSVLLRRLGQPMAALGWLFALFALPAVTLMAWWLIGRTHLERKRRIRKSASLEASRTLQECQPEVTHSAIPPLATAKYENHPFFQVFSRLLAIDDLALSPASRLELLPITEVVHRQWFALIDGAQHHLHLLFYIWRDDSIGRRLRDQLTAKARGGVEVRVLVDGVGSLGLSRRFFAELLAAGGEVRYFMPLRPSPAAATLNFRNHRKLLIADGCTAYTGGVNVGDEYLAWQDLGVVLEGNIVHQLQEVFVDDWHFVTGDTLIAPVYFPRVSSEKDSVYCSVIGSGPDQDVNLMRDAISLAIMQSQQRLWILTPYFIPDEHMLASLRLAVFRGVDVRVYVPAKSDSLWVKRASRAFYPQLLRCGVKVYEYEGMLHAKALLIDSVATLVGSANMDIRSFRLNFEIGVVVFDKTINKQLASLCKDVECSSRLQTLSRQHPIQRFVDAIAHLLSPLL